MDQPDFTPVTDRLVLVNSATSGRFPMAYSFLVLGTDTHALIDTGCGPAACKKAADKYGVDVVINSHCHPDHVSGNHLFAGKELWVPEQRVEEVGAVKKLSRRLVGPDPHIMAVWEGFVKKHLGMGDYEPTHTYADGHVFDFGGIAFQAVHTPGHLDDHYCFLEPREHLLLTFDVDLTTFGPFYGNPESDIPQFKESMDTIMGLEPRVLASSHQMPIRENTQKELQDFLNKFDRNERRVAAVLEIPRTLEEICERKPIFGKYIPGLETLYTFFEMWMIKNHLKCMEEEGRVQFTQGRYSLVGPSRI